MMRSAGRCGWKGSQRCRNLRRTVVWLFVVAAVGLPRPATAQMSTSELFDRLSWLIVIPIGVVQTLAALWLRGRVEKSAVSGTLLASALAVGTGLLAALFADPGWLRSAMLVLYFVPGLPTLITLGRQRQWGAAILLFLIPPAPFAFLPR
jgi:hypothetical protein